MAYHWSMRTDLRHLIIDTTLSFNKYIACDQKLAIYQLLRAMIDNVPCLNKSYNRLDKYHLLTNIWKARVIVTVSGIEVKAVLKNIVSMLSSFLITQRVKMK